MAIKEFSAAWMIDLVGISLLSSANQEHALEEMKKELQARPTAKLVDDLRKKVKILQVNTCQYHTTFKQ